jgi:hypothetical protein
MTEMATIIIIKAMTITTEIIITISLVVVVVVLKPLLRIRIIRREMEVLDNNNLIRIIHTPCTITIIITIITIIIIITPTINTIIITMVVVE